ncbi:MAG: glycosyltransferase [Planctomycetes bacterium]|nr:glycosyltransferase [Planctomycetota bacterium]
MNPRPRILLSAYACEPGRGSEPGVGWNWTRSLSNLVDLTVITRANNRPIIEAWEADHGSVGVTWVWFDRSEAYLRLKRQLGARWYYRHWQRELLSVAEDLHATSPFDAAMHLTMNGFREPGWLWKLPIPFIWGPIGGLQNASSLLVAPQGWRRRTIEGIRSRLNRLTAKFALRPRQAAKAAALVLGANRDSMLWLDGLGLPSDRCLQMLEAGITAADQSNPAQRDRSSILWVGSDAHLKNPEFAITAFAALRRQETTMTLTMIGIGDTRWAELSTWAKRKGLDTSGILRIRRLPQHDLTQHYRRCGQFWFTSYRDTSGNVLLEAMATGAPCIGFDHQGVPAIMPGSTGVRITPGEWHSTAQRWAMAAAAYHADVDFADRIGKAAHDLCRGEHRWETKAATVVSHLHRILGRPCP